MELDSVEWIVFGFHDSCIGLIAAGCGRGCHQIPEPVQLGVIIEICFVYCPIVIVLQNSRAGCGSLEKVLCEVCEDVGRFAQVFN